ncbi:hypothetical protein [Treponema sp.]|uniref:hypothetical protein n=1 Tax=Treponema sp. TaxID=166 RepID=UPI003890A6DF
MIEFENTEVFGWKAAIRGMRNPMNSWDKSDSLIDYYGLYELGENDLKLMKNLIAAGSDHSKFMRMINVTVDITAPRLWWIEADTYKVGTVKNSCSTMHKIHSKEFTLDDFSVEHLTELSLNQISYTITALNYNRELYLAEADKENRKKIWWQMIQLLPQSYNQKATVQLNYAVLRNMYHSRKNHKLDEWSVGFVEWVKNLPYSDLITDES